MIRSMTGFGAAAAETESLRATVSVRSVNHRYLELTCHLSRRVAALEPEIKSLVQARLARGRVEVFVHAVFPDASAQVVMSSRALADALVRVLREMQAQYGLEGGIRPAEIARFPGVLEVVEEGGVLDEARGRALLALVGEALEGLEGMRRAEGDHLGDDLAACLGRIEEAAGRIEALQEGAKAARREALLEKARGLVADLGLDEGRLYQELARLVDRNDVAEELQRLRSHVGQARGFVTSDAAAGKKLDFLAQEMMREANTIGSKAASAPLVQEVVALKAEVEKLREQVQNVE